VLQGEIDDGLRLDDFVQVDCLLLVVLIADEVVVVGAVHFLIVRFVVGVQVGNLLVKFALLFGLLLGVGLLILLKRFVHVLLINHFVVRGLFRFRLLVGLLV